MKFNLKRNGIEITPECEADVAYIEDTLNLRNANDSLLLIRHNCKGNELTNKDLHSLQTTQLRSAVYSPGKPKYKCTCNNGCNSSDCDKV